MARLPEIRPSTAVSNVAATPAPLAGQGFAALAELASVGADFVRPAANDQARQEGEASVYRDEEGNLQVDDRDLFSGEFGVIHNSAAYAKYLSQKQMDIQNTFTELSAQYEFDPDGFKQAADGYVGILGQDENIPSLLKEELMASVKQEASRRFNGLYRSQVKRDQNDANTSTNAARDMLVDDYVALSVAGDVAGAEAKLAEIQSINDFRANAPYIGDTPEETELFMRGVRGTAKAASLTRMLTDLEDASEVSDETRAVIQAVLDDPDISPKARHSLYTATQGRLKGIDGRAAVKAMTDSSYEGMIVRAESGGVNNAANPLSSAYGPHQFLKGTWMGLVKKYQPEWAAGLSEKQLLALRGDRAKSSEMFSHFRRENQAVLASNGVPVNPATEYMAHFFGAGTAAKVLRADPNASIESLVPESVMKANPFLKGMSSRDALNWAGRKMTMKSSDLAGMAVDVAGIEDPEVRAAAAAALTQQINARKAIETAAAEVFKERLVQGDTSVTAQSILEDHDLDTDMQISLINTLKGMQKEQSTVQNISAALADPSFVFDPYNSTQRGNVDKAYMAALDGNDPMSDQGLSTAVQISDRTGVVPKSAFNALRGAAKSDDPATVARAMETLGRLVEKQPTSIDPHGGSSEVSKALADYRRRAEFATPEEAAQGMIDAREDVPKNVRDQAKEAKKKLKPADITDHFDGSVLGDPKFATPIQEDEAMAEYSRLFEEAFVETGNFETAQAQSLEQMGRIYGVSSITGGQSLMKYPPQHFYPAVRGSHDWMSEQLEREVSDFVFGDTARKPSASLTDRFIDGASLGGAHDWIGKKQIKVVSDSQTRADITAGRPASYRVFYLNGDILELIPQRFAFDPTGEQYNAHYDFQDTREAQQFVGSARRNFYENVEKYGHDQALKMIQEEEGNAVPE